MKKIKKFLVLSIMALTILFGVNVQSNKQVATQTPTQTEVSSVSLLASSYPYPTNPAWPGYNMGTWLVGKYDYNVEQLQYRLTALGFSTNGVDGYYGTNTKTAVSNYQYWNGLTVDGICGQQTWNDIFQ
jgi:peptidoglycan hydrolase-like protein with peptidoglycan-binding domain